MQQDSNEIAIAVAIIFNQSDELLTVRKKGSDYYQLPGGKIEHKERAIDALLRELQEELRLTLPATCFQFRGIESAQAVNEKGYRVQGHVFQYSPVFEDVEIHVQAEIEEKRWIRQEEYGKIALANLLKKVVGPYWKR